MRRLLAAIVIMLVVPMVALSATTENAAKEQAVHGGMLALTFDDGPTPGFTDKVLDVLKAKGVKATFFVQGNRVDAHPELLARINAEGHQIGNHSYTHRIFNQIDSAAVRDELVRTNRAIEKVTGHTPKMVRYPQAVETTEGNEVVRELGMTGTVGWHWAGEPGRDDWTCSGVDAAFDFAVDSSTDGAIILAHDGNEVTLCMDQLVWLEKYIDWAHAHGYTFGLLKTADKPNVLNANSWVDVVEPAKAERWMQRR